MNQPWNGAPNQPYPAYPPPTPESRKNTVGLIALIAGVIGFVFACVPGALIVGWVLLPIAFILGIVGVCITGKSRGTSIAAIVVSVVGVVVGVVVFTFVVSDAFKDAFSTSDLSGDSTKPAAAGASTPPKANPENEEGGRGNPYLIGQTVSNKEWQVTLGAPREAGAAVAAENQFNDEAPPGQEFWIVPVTATYIGNETGNLAFGIRVKFVGVDNRTYDDSCGVIPNALDDVGDLYNGGSAQGNVCVAVPAGADGLWSVTTGFGDPVFFRER